MPARKKFKIAQKVKLDRFRNVVLVQVVAITTGAATQLETRHFFKVYDVQISDN